MTRAEKIAFVRDQLQQLDKINHTCTEQEWIMLKLSCTKKQAESLIAAARQA